MRALISGWKGFLGRNLVERLSLDPDWDVRLFVGRVEEPNVASRMLAFHKPDVVFHLASTHYHSPGRTLTPQDHVSTNVSGTLAVLEAVRQCAPACRVVYTGTSMVYGSGRNLCESAPLGPNTMLGATKAAASLLCHAYARAHGVHTVELRLFTPYGPHEQRHRLIPAAIRAALAGRDFEMTSGEQERDFVYVNDVVDALVLAAVKDVLSGSVFNIGSGVATEVMEAVNLIRLMMKPEGRTVCTLPKRPDEVNLMSADISTAKQVLGWEPKTPLTAGLARCIEWWSKKA